MNSPLVYIVLVNYKNWQDTLECLESLLKMSYPNFKVVVVDNSSHNGSISHLKDWLEGKATVAFNESFYITTAVENYQVHKPIAYAHLSSTDITEIKATTDDKLYLVESDANLGFAGGNNLGINLAVNHKAGYVWLLNNDTVVAKDTLTNLVACFEEETLQQQQLGILGSKLLYYHNPQLVQAILGRYNPLTASTTHVGLNKEAATYRFDDLQIGADDYVVGASMFVSSKFIKEVGLMSEDYFLYFEEIDWVKRGAAKNFNIDVCLKAVVYHKEGAAIGGGIKDNNNKSELSDFYSIRNRLIITKKFYPKYLYPVYISLLLVAANRVKRMQFKRIPLIFRALKSSMKSIS